LHSRLVPFGLDACDSASLRWGRDSLSL